MKQFQKSLAITIVFFLAFVHSAICQTTTLGKYFTTQELQNINKQQIKGAFCEYQLQQCDSIAEQQKAAINALQQAAEELRQAINEKHIITDFYKQDAADNLQLYKQSEKKFASEVNKKSFWRILAFVGFITSVIFAVQ